MEQFSMKCMMYEEQLIVKWFIYSSDEWGGDDFVKTFSFDRENSLKLFALLGVDCSMNLTVYMDERFGHDLYNPGLDKFCREHEIHYKWHEYVDYPGIYDKSGVC